MLTHAELESRAYITGDTRAAQILATLAEAEDLSEANEDAASEAGEMLDNALGDIPDDIPDYLGAIHDDLRAEADALTLAGLDTADLLALADRVAEEAKDLRVALGQIRRRIEKAQKRLQEIAT